MSIDVIRETERHDLSFFNMIFAVGSVIFQLIAGGMGQVMPYRMAVVILSAFTLGCMVILIVIPAQENRPVYEAVGAREKI